MPKREWILRQEKKRSGPVSRKISPGCQAKAGSMSQAVASRTDTSSKENNGVSSLEMEELEWRGGALRPEMTEMSDKQDEEQKWRIISWKPAKASTLFTPRSDPATLYLFVLNFWKT
ncbi:uncharacterized protein LOC143809763 [Ranitomeya variabilis]|uniref:uncharacterized protein LOC143809763 n=1 Tax=Ranitomeya variabilis TaxID=490064 RepID=UPI004056BD70